MRRTSSTSFLLSVLVLCAALAPRLAAQDGHAALLQAQGEYAGHVTGVDPRDAGRTAVGAQLVGLCDPDGGQPRLQMVLHLGGLPGAGWRRGDPRRVFEAPLVDGVARFGKGDLTATLSDGVIVFADPDGKSEGRLEKVVRESPTLGAPPPPGAVVLFDGTSA
ncbi:MAG: hypothetical protein KAI24_07315, partial [Planctomycetes bacterium]|nr:hypothetical protein [Planctomycetota bacterium]